MVPGGINAVLAEVHKRWLPFCEALPHQPARSFVAISGAHVDAVGGVLVPTLQVQKWKL